MKIAYGKNTPTSATDPEVIEMHRMVRMITGILRPGAYLVESLPWLKYLPWYGRDLKLGFERTKKFYLGQLKRVREQIVYISFRILTSCLTRSTAERRGHRPFVHKTYARR
jgi:hypothetical protein